MAEPYSCRLCSPPQPVGRGELDDHLRLLHPRRYETLHASGRLPDEPPDVPLRRPANSPAVVCECGVILYGGDAYAERPVGVASGTPVLEVVCAECGEAGGSG